ncbi:hypothetical protein O3G_MSEX011279 [Manduca sexta]|uniref:Uncharacterized protein n=1 Tax=Manduca sexta TaxID=7130 RepID=A0A921ZJL7_MANSE|nr:hypothetical protein O3G_MSEX011279 [Manduca sexta]KAG6459238.1 hypothetical protein O3G_MSEX011279 [Manduca sexta]
MTPPGTPERAALSPVSNVSLHDFWPSVSSVSDNDEDTLFDMLLNTLSLEGGGLEGEDARPATPPVQPWIPPTVPPTPTHSTHNHSNHSSSPVPGPSGLNGHSSHSAPSSSPPHMD